MTAKTMIAAVALVLIGVVAGMNVPQVEAQRQGPYAITAMGNVVWRIATHTGQVSLCHTIDSKPRNARLIEKVPRCGPWSDLGN